MAIVTLSRQFGTGAKYLGEMVAQRLNYILADNDLIQMVAQKAKVSEDWVATMEKEAGGKLKQFIGGLVPKSLIDHILDGEHGHIDEEIYVDLLHDIVAKIAAEDDAVIIGRGSQYILAGRPNCFHTLVVADYADRVRFLEKKYNLSNEQARRSIDLDDRRRINLYHKFNKSDYDRPEHYHLVLNMSKLDLESACAILLALIEQYTKTKTQ